MEIKSVKTNKVIPGNNLFKLLDKYLVNINEGSIVAVTSKIVSICEGRVVKVGDIDKELLVKKEADFIIPAQKNKYNITLTIKNSVLIPTAGIDESNGNNYYILWPSDPQKAANKIRQYLCKRFSINKVGVIITDSKTTPLRWGTSGIAIAHSGFSALKDYIGKADIFGRKLKVTKANIADALASAAVLVMGEGNEQTPIAIINDIPFVAFQQRNPTKKELDSLLIKLEDDLYAPILESARWEKGRK